MRLTKFEIDSIKETIKKYDPEAGVYLFGSRTDDSKKGGDIDLFIISAKITINEKIKIKTGLYKLIGEQKIDIVVSPGLENAFQRYVFDASQKL